MTTTVPAPRAMIEIHGLWKAFHGQPVLKGVELSIPEGQVFVLLGSSGSGKTVLMKHIEGLLKPDRGTVVVDGHDLAALDARGLEAVRHELGIQFQAGALFDSMSVADNVAFPLREVGHLPAAEVATKVRATLELFGLSHAARQLPGELSGGMKKRVAFARAIVVQPRILLSDEPTAGLDPLTMEAVDEAIVTARKATGATAFVITHSLSTAFRVADLVGLLHDGRVVEVSPPERFKASSHPAVHQFLHLWLEREAAPA